jgi:hypothetical protein
MPSGAMYLGEFSSSDEALQKLLLCLEIHRNLK